MRSHVGAAGAVMLALVLAMGGARAMEYADGTVIIQQQVAPDYFLTFTPAMPEPGTEVVVSMDGQSGPARVDGIRWSLSGSPASGAGVKAGDPARYAFTPSVPGSYMITASFRDPQGTVVSSTLEIVIGAGISSGGVQGAPVFPDIYLGADPAQPRLGKAAAFTLHFDGGVPADASVSWEVSGGTMTSPSTSGKNNETYSFIPTSQSTYYVKATLQNGQGFVMGEVSLGFIPVP